MDNKNFNTPILFLVFNRPDVTLRVFQEIRKIKPTRLFIAADGPRKNKEGEEEKCRKVKEIFNEIDWDCEISTLYRKNNLGCANAVSEAITWFFDNVEQGIILEDDCLPDLSFFRFCEEMLLKYRDNKRVMHVSGESYYKERVYSYYLSTYPIVGAWATWKDRWRLFDLKMKNLDSFINKEGVNKISNNSRIQSYLVDKLTNLKNVDSWAYPWSFTIFIHDGICIHPSVNAITNIGYSNNATHTQLPGWLHFRANLKRFRIKFPIIHPPKIEKSIGVNDKVAMALGFIKMNKIQRIKFKLFSLIKKHVDGR